MPPKTTTARKTTRAALRAKQPEEKESTSGERDSATAKPTVSGNKRRATKPRDSDKPKEPDKKRSRARTTKSAAAAAASAAEDGTSEGERRAGGRARKQTKKDKMASAVTSRKRRQKAAQTTDAVEDVTVEADAESSEVKTETPPPSKRRKDKKKSEEPVEETDRVVVGPPPVSVAMGTKKRPKKAVKIVGSEPTPMETDAIISHRSHSTVCGEVFVMGQGDMGQLGLGEDMLERKKPHPVGGALEGVRVTQVVCGGMHTVALTDKGKVYTWGCNDEGALGRTIEEGQEFTPGIIDKLEGVNIVQVATGDSHTIALSNTGTVYGWGTFRDSNGAFGFLPPPSPPTPSLSPRTLYSVPSNKALKIASGSDHVAIVTEHGDIYTLGCAEQGQLGRVAECFSSRGGRKGLSLLLRPDVVRFRVKKGTGKPKFTNVFCGPYHTFAVSQSGAVYAWGLNNYGQLCIGDIVNRYQPELLEDGWIWVGGRGLVGGAKDFRIASGSHHTVVCCGGDVWSCGRKEYGRLGLGQDCEETSLPTHVEGLKGVKVASVEAGGACSFVVTETGEVYSWGMGTNLQLGMSDEEDVWSPEKVVGKKMENRRTVAVTIGGQHTALLVSRDAE